MYIFLRFSIRCLLSEPSRSTLPLCPLAGGLHPPGVVASLLLPASRLLGFGECFPRPHEPRCRRLGEAGVGEPASTPGASVLPPAILLFVPTICILMPFEMSYKIKLIDLCI